MKKILLATTILAMSAGYAAADITWAGSAAAGIAKQGTTAAVAAGTAAEIATATATLTAAKAAYTASPSSVNWAAVVAAEAGLAAVSGSAAGVAGPFQTYSSVNLAVTFSGASDSGLTYGATFDMSAGRSYTLGDGDSFAAESGAFGMPTVWIEGSYGKLAISSDNYDFYDDTNSGGDAEYTGTFGGVSVGLIADVDSNNASVSLGYTAGNLALSGNTDTYGLSNISAAYTMGSIVVTAATDESAQSSLKVAYSANGMSASAQYNTSDASVDLAAGYVVYGITVNAGTNTVSNHWTVTAAYDLGGGLSVVAGTNYTTDLMIGAKMAF